MVEPTWRTRALVATRGSQTGAILSCVFGANEGQMPRFEHKAIVTSDGYIQCDFVDGNGGWHAGAFVGAADDFSRNLHTLSGYLCLTTDERQELATLIREWIADDWSGGSYFWSAP